MIFAGSNAPTVLLSYLEASSRDATRRREAVKEPQRQRSTCRTSRSAILLVLLLTMPGCGTFGNRPLSAGNYQTASLRYQLDACDLGVPVAVARVGARQVSYEQVVADPATAQAVGTLEIQYPHPGDRPGMALVGVVIQRQQARHGLTSIVDRWWRRLDRGDRQFLSCSPHESHEAWVLDVPKDKLDALLATLPNDSTAEKAKTGRAIRLSTNVDGKRWAGPCPQVPALDALMHQARREGQLVSYQRPAGPVQGHQFAR